MGLLNLFIILFIIVMLHEGGHLIVAKINKVRVKTFSIGFGSRIFGFKMCRGKSGKLYFSWKWFNFKPYNKEIWQWEELTEYRIAPILLGGFCAMGGETKSTGKDSDLVSKSYWQKVSIVVAGVCVNFITGFLAIFSIFISRVGFFKGFILTCKLIFDVIIGTFFALGLLLIGKGHLTTASETHIMMNNLPFSSLVLFFGVFSIVLGVFNLLPIPALDGGFIWLWIVEKYKKNGQIFVDNIVKIGFILLMLLQIVILFFWLR